MSIKLLACKLIRITNYPSNFTYNERSAVAYKKRSVIEFYISFQSNIGAKPAHSWPGYSSGTSRWRSSWNRSNVSLVSPHCFRISHVALQNVCQWLCHSQNHTTRIWYLFCRMPIVFGHFTETGTAFAILYYLGLALIGLVSHISMFELVIRGLVDLGRKLF